MKQYISNRPILTKEDVDYATKLGFRTDDDYVDYNPFIGCFNIVKNYHYTYGYIIVIINLSKLGSKVIIHNHTRDCEIDLQELQYTISKVAKHIENDLYALEQKGIISKYFKIS